MLSPLFLIALCLSTDDPKPKQKPRAAAMVLDLAGKVEIRPVEGKPRAAERGDLLYPGERLAVPADGAATVAILRDGVKEDIKPGSVAVVGPDRCTPPDAVTSRTPQPRAVATVMSGLKPASGDGRKAGVGFRGGPETPQLITPIFGSTIADERPGLAWPPAEKAEVYRVRLLADGSNREIWRAETKLPRVAFPEGKESLRPGYSYRWEVTDQVFRPVASGRFVVANQSELDQLKDLKDLAASANRGDRWAAALAYQRIGAYDLAIATFERLVKDAPEERLYQQGLAELSRLAGRAPVTPAGK